MNVPTLRYDHVGSITELLLRALCPVASIAKRRERVAIPTRKRVRDREPQTGFVGYFWGVLVAPPRHCIECFKDIPHHTERCPHCRVLQRAEDERLRRRDAGWV